MKCSSLLLVLALILITLSGATAFAQDNGSVVGWGSVSTVPPDQVHDVVQVVLGDHLIARRSDNTLVAWGQNTLYVEGFQCVIPEPNMDFIDIAATRNCSFGLKPDGIIIRWGSDQHPWDWLPHPNTGFDAIFAGREALFARRADGSLAADGSLGDRANIPAPNLDFVSVAIGADFVVGIKSDTSLVVWGDITGRDALLPPEANSGFVKVVAGTQHWIGLRDDGSIVHRGYRVGEAPGSIVPLDGTIPVPNEDFTDIAAFDAESWVLNADGSVTGWTTYNSSLRPGPVPNSGTVSITGGENCGAAVRWDGRIKMWGTVPPELVNGPAFNYGIVDVAIHMALDLSGVALLADGSLAAWGASTHVPTSVEPIVAIDSGGEGHLALDAAGQVYEFTHYDHTLPDMGSEPGDRVVAISAGGNHSLALQEDGDVIAWGSNSQGQCDVPTFPLPVVAISAGGVHSVAVLEDGSVVGWGDNRYGQADNQGPGTSSSIIAAGQWHTSALTPSRTLIGWGKSDDGETDNPVPTWQFTRLRAGNNTQALGDNGLLLVLGSDRFGQVDYPIPDDSILAFDTDGYASVMVVVRPTPTDVAEPATALRAVRILGARPNPFNPSTEIWFTAPAGQPVVLKAFDLRGRLVESLFEGTGLGVPASFTWRPEAQASGVYFLRIESGGRTDVIKTLLLK